MSIDEVAKHLKLTPQQVRNLCRQGKIKADKISNSWVVRNNDLLLYKKRKFPGVAEKHIIYQVNQHQRPIALSFFSGTMGMDIGLEKAGFETILACEIDKALV